MVVFSFGCACEFCSLPLLARTGRDPDLMDVAAAYYTLMNAIKSGLLIKVESKNKQRKETIPLSVQKYA